MGARPQSGRTAGGSAAGQTEPALCVSGPREYWPDCSEAGEAPNPLHASTLPASHSPKSAAAGAASAGNNGINAAHGQTQSSSLGLSYGEGTKSAFVSPGAPSLTSGGATLSSPSPSRADPLKLGSSSAGMATSRGRLGMPDRPPPIVSKFPFSPAATSCLGSFLGDTPGGRKDGPGAGAGGTEDPKSIDSQRKVLVPAGKTCLLPLTNVFMWDIFPNIKYEPIRGRYNVM